MYIKLPNRLTLREWFSAYLILDEALWIPVGDSDALDAVCCDQSVRLWASSTSTHPSLMDQVASTKTPHCRSSSCNPRLRHRSTEPFAAQPVRPDQMAAIFLTVFGQMLFLRHPAEPRQTVRIPGQGQESP